MSDEQPRSETGQFAPSELPTGQASVAEIQGYRAMPEPAEREIEISTVEQEAANLKASREIELPVETVELAYRDGDGSVTDPSLTVTQERAVKDNSDYHASQRETAERHLSAEFRAEVLKQRAELVAAAPETAEQLGINADETIIKAVEANPELVADQPAEPTRPETATRADDGRVSPETRKAIETNPELRQYLESNSAETSQAVETFKAATDNALKFGQGALQAIAPELERVPLEQWGQAIQIIAQSDPVKGQMIAKTLQNIVALGQRQELIQAYESDQQRIQLDTWRAQQNAIMDKKVPLTRAAKAEFADDLLSYASERGITLESLRHQYETNPLMHSAAFQELLYKGIQYEKMLKAPKPRPTRENVPVTRPGTASHKAAGDSSSNVASLRAKVSNSTGHAAIRAAAKLQRAMRGD
jgi:hypothetical protein